MNVDEVDARFRVAALVALVAYLALSVWAVTAGGDLAILLADAVFVVAIVGFGLYVRVAQAGDDYLLRVTGSLLVASGLSQAYLMLDPEGPVTPLVPNLLVIGGGLLYLWAMSGRSGSAS